jgi:ABC-2 type transport system ATP-binding protein/nitrous oxidase accessory protein
MLTATSVGKRYGRLTAIDGVSVEAGAGEVVALVGPNGAGKSTLLKCIVGLIRYEGQILVGGIDVARHGKRARRLIGYLPQQPALHHELRVRETALFYAELRGVGVESAQRAVAEAGLADHAEKPVGALSGGMRQRLALALALLGDPPLLLLDEPAASLDVAAQLELRTLVQEQRAKGKTILLSTHHPEDLPQVADRALLLEDGRVRFYGPAAECAFRELSNSRVYLRLNGRGPDATPLLRSIPAVERLDQSGEWLVATCPAAEKARVLEAVIGAGIPVLDFHVEDLGGAARSRREGAER